MELTGGSYKTTAFDVEIADCGFRKIPESMHRSTRKNGAPEVTESREVNRLAEDRCDESIRSAPISALSFRLSAPTGARSGSPWPAARRPLAS